ncbi:carbohydrate ABC transporter permease [Massiliimalia massiliensis]|uniref:carbohydrate ABC transporter permease n=1 Tax=Massiliimalia massiliensis TaxID=1852384 RepID=UPI000986CC9C|nr:carbohydrate ABC transporter permease [Massiliimalia massiliensis]
MSKKKQREILWHLPLHLILIPVSLCIVLPFILMCATSFKEAGEIFTYPPQIFGKVFTFENYDWLFNKVTFLQYFMNSLKIAVIVTIGQLFTSSLAGYVFAKLKFKGRDKLFFLYLATLMVPAHVTLIPNFIIFKMLGLVDTHTALILPGLATAFGTFLMRQFFITMPDELSEAAKIDGCSQFGIFSRIFLPLSKPALATLGIFVFNGSWTDYLNPLVFIISPEKVTLTVGVASLQGTYATNWGVLMAGLTISVLPVLILFFAAQDFFVKGIVMTGMKA